MEETKKITPIQGMGAFSMLGLYSLLLVITLVAKVRYDKILDNLYKLVTGQVSMIPSGSETTLLQAGLEMIAVVIVIIPIAIILGNIFSRNTKSYDRAALDAMLDRGPWAIFAIVALEEIFTRGFFLGLLTRLFTGDIAFYALFLLGNSVWAYLHVRNFKDQSEQSVLRVIPQFVGGIAFTYILVRFGLGGAILTHFLYNVVIMSSMKEKDSFAANAVNAVYYLIAGVILFFIAKANGLAVSDITPWLNGKIEPLAGYEFFDYAVIIMLINCIVSFVISVLLLDSADVKNDAYQKIADLKGFGFVIFMIVAAAIAVFIILAGNWVLGFFITNVAIKALVMSITMVMISKTSSGSSLARSAVVNFPVTFLIIAAFSVLGFWTSFGIALVSNFLDFIPNYLESKS